MDISINKPAKHYLKRQFEKWYSEMVMQQLDESDIEDLEQSDMQPTDLGMTILKEVGAKWFVVMPEYISDNLSFIVNGFLSSRITAAIDGVVELGSDSNDSGTDGDCDSDSVVCDISDDQTVYSSC